MDYGIIFNNLLIIFIMIMAGFGAGRIHLVSDEGLGHFNSFVLNITLPATILVSMQRKMDIALLKDSIIIFSLALIFFGCSLFITPFIAKLFRVPKEKLPVWVVCSSLCNSGFMGFPLALAIFENDGLFLAAMMNIGYNFIAFIFGPRSMCMNQKGDTSVNLKSILLMPVNIVTVIGMIFFIGQLSLPASLYSVVSSFASITTPLSMFLVGLSLSRGKILEVFKDREVFTIALMRLILIPLAAVAIMRLLPWRNDSLLVGVAVLIMAMPCPSLGLVFAQQYHEDTALASKATFFTSFACMITIPLILLFVS